MDAAQQVDRSPVALPYWPRPIFEPLHERAQRWAVVVAHRRAGKTVACVNELIKAALTNVRTDPPPRYAYVAPTNGQAKDVAWSYLKHYAGPIPGCEVREAELTIRLPLGGLVRLYGADAYDRLRGLYLDGVVVDEPADIDPRAWPEVIRPTLADYSGWAVFIGTPKGPGHFRNLVIEAERDPAWLVMRLPASRTGILGADELADARRTMSAEQYLQEFECSFEAAVVGSYYGKPMAEADSEGRVTRVPYDPVAQVWTAWDLGIADATAIWFAQVVGREVHVIDYYETSGADLGHYVREIVRRPYVYGGHIVPHDAQAKELGTGKSRLEVLASLGLKGIAVTPNHRVEDGINAVRMLLPRCWFDKERCERGIDALRLYRADYDAKGETLRPRAVHDWTSHAADAFRYLAMGLEAVAPAVSFDVAKFMRGMRGEWR
jgi:phage terminase large subunit